MNENPRGPNLDELARQLVGAIPQNLKALSEDMERNLKALLHSGLERMDLVTREEFDLQSAVLERTREKLEALEARLAELETRQAGVPEGADSAVAPGGLRGPAGGEGSAGPEGLGGVSAVGGAGVPADAADASRTEPRQPPEGVPRPGREHGSD